MKRLEVNPKNEKYYTKDFISGFRCGTKRQLESDLTILDKIRAEIQKLPITDTAVRLVTEVLDKYKAESEEEYGVI